MRFGSVCSGIEAASVAWHPLGWRAAWLAEIEPFPCAVLAHHYPDTPNLGDMSTLAARILSGEVEAPDLFCGGTPCQAFSVAGLRRSLGDARGNLSLTFCEIADAIDTMRRIRGHQPAIIFWENVPGVLSTRDNAFGCFLAGIAGEDEPLEPPGGKWANAGAVLGPKRSVAWRTLDAQFFGLAQRRRRVFVVASARADFDPAAVLFEWDGVRRDSAPRREAGEAAAGSVVARAEGGGFPGTDGACGGHVVPVAFPANLSGTQHASTSNLAPAMGAKNPTAVAVALRGREGGATAELGDEVQNCLRASSGGGDKPHVLAPVAVVHAIQAGALRVNPASGPGGVGVQADHAYTLEARAEVQAVQAAMQVRRLTPVECERLQGFPDGYTAVPWRRGKLDAFITGDECPDGPRYKALGNSWAVPVVRWIGRRIDGQLIGGLI